MAFSLVTCSIQSSKLQCRQVCRYRKCIVSPVGDGPQPVALVLRGASDHNLEILQALAEILDVLHPFHIKSCDKALVNLPYLLSCRSPFGQAVLGGTEPDGNKVTDRLSMTDLSSRVTNLLDLSSGSLSTEVDDED